MPIPVPAGVTVTIDGSDVTVKGKNGTLRRSFHPNMTIAREGEELLVTRPDDGKENRSLHGLTRSLLSNMVVGVSEGFKKDLEINGVGYRAVKQGKQMTLTIGYSHPVVIDEVPGITIDVPAPNKITVSGADKQLVGEVAANIRKKRPPEPYKGKGIKYADERIRRKEGKSGKT